MVYPTDSGYAIGCSAQSKTGLSRIKKLRQLPKGHLFTLMCENLSSVSLYTRISTPVYRLIRAHTPGAYTFVVEANHSLSKLLGQKRKTLGVRIPGHPVILSILAEYGQAVLTASLHVVPEDDEDDLGNDQEATVLDAGDCCGDFTSIIDLSEQEAVVIREGKGDCSYFV